MADRGRRRRKKWAAVDRVREFVAHASAVNAVAVGQQSGQVLVTGGDDRKLNLWRVDKPANLISVAAHSTPVECVRFNRNEEVVAAGSRGGSLKLFDLPAGGRTLRALAGHRSAVHAAAFHPYGDFVASGSLDTNLKVWDVRRKSCIQTYKGHTQGVRVVRFSPDGRWVASGAACASESR